MATIHTGSHNTFVDVRRTIPWTAPITRRRLRDLLSFAGGVLGAVFAAELVLPEADPDEVRGMLVELGRLDAAALPPARIEALRAFQAEKALPPDGAAYGRTVTELMRDVRERRELRELGLPVN
ncbi:hypothetical protein [Actinorugispora endophytica]|nr:hypothetical protein [Actinorugispora endophytica]